MIRIYTDSETTNTIEALDLGRVLLGETKKYTVFIKNTDTEYSYIISRLKTLIQNLDLKAPQTLQANEVKEVSVYWTPKLDSRKPLRTEFKFSGDIFIG